MPTTTEVIVVFYKVAHEYVCEAVIHLSTGLNAQARGHAAENLCGVRILPRKMDKQLRRYIKTYPQPPSFPYGTC